MDADECFRTFVQCHEDHARGNGTTQTANCLEITAIDDLSGPWIASQFAQEVTKLLSKDELAQLFEFLKAPKAGWRNTGEIT
jgi:hypothetical protein